MAELRNGSRAYQTVRRETWEPGGWSREASGTLVRPFSRVPLATEGKGLKAASFLASPHSQGMKLGGQLLTASRHQKRLASFYLMLGLNQCLANSWDTVNTYYRNE